MDFIGFYDSNYFNEEVIPFNCLNIVDCMAYRKCVKCEAFEKEIKTPVFDFFLHEDFGNRHRTIMADIKSYSSCKNLLDNIWDIDNLYTDLHLKIANSPFYEKDYLLS